MFLKIREVLFFVFCLLLAALFIGFNVLQTVQEKDKETIVKTYEAELRVGSEIKAYQNHVVLLRSIAEEKINQGSKDLGTLRSRIKEVSGRGWEVMPSNLDSGSLLGRLTGTSSLADLSDATLHEIYTVEQLNNSFTTVQTNLSNSPLVYYFSGNHFGNLVPRITEDFAFFEDGYLDYELFTLGLPAVNPERNVFWTKPYIDAAMKGVIVTIGVPVYRQGQFKGTICIDMNFKEISSYLQSSVFEHDQISLIDDYHQIVSSTIPEMLNDQELQSFSHLVQEESRDIDAYKIKEHFWIGNQRIYISPVPGSKWFIVHSESRHEFYLAVFTRLLPLIGLVVLILTSIFFVLYINRLRVLNEQEKIKAEKANATKDNFLSIIAHDLRNPLLSIMGVSDLLTSGKHELSRDEQAKFIRHIGTGTNQLYQLLNNLLEWALLQTQELSFNPTSQNLKIIFEEQITHFEMFIIDKEINLNASVDEHMIVHADVNMLKTILRNLISNAIKFTPRAGNIWLSAHEKDGSIVIVVKDNGVGMTPKQQNDLFSLNKKATTAGTEKEQGTGLGLVLCLDFVNQHNGHINVESTEHGGTSILITLPLI